ncbi:MAG: 3-oxoacyl-ACP reductase FabG, partial [Nitrosomonadaceae bacterium]|nr:3-oxoacyl-ACP reductase FabG [Nitrosomonadaceae bacterium]
AMTAAGITASDAVAMHADVSDYDAAGEMAKAIEAQYGPVSVLVNCAGITRDASIRKMTIEQWRAVMSTNLDSAFNMTKHVIEGMIAANWGRIINISSVNGVKGSFGQTTYAAAKAGILGFTKSLALEVAKKGVTVNAISPGFIDTAMTKAIPDAVRAGIVASIPTERMGTPEDIANAISFLASDASSYVTGTNLSVNGGVHMYQ